MKRPMKKPLAPAKSKRPQGKPADMESMQALKRGENAAKREAEDYKTLAPKKMKMGGTCRGMGSASKGGKYKA